MKKLDVKFVKDSDFVKIVTEAKNIREALVKLGLKPRGGNYELLRARCVKLGISPPYTQAKTDQKTIRNNVSDEELKNAISSHFGKRSTLWSLGLSNNTSSNIEWLTARIAELKLSTKHWTGQGHGNGGAHIFDLSEILVTGKYQNSTKLKKRLVKCGLLDYKCSKCGISDWQETVLTLHLDHINGIRTDNRLENLRLLCPNCHSQMDTYAGRNIKKSVNISSCVCGTVKNYSAKSCVNCKIINGRKKPQKLCKCGKPINDRSLFCGSCSHVNLRKTNWPTSEELQILLWDKPTTEIARSFGVSDKAVEKWAKKFGLAKPPPGYWAKRKAGKL